MVRFLKWIGAVAALVAAIALAGPAFAGSRTSVVIGVGTVFGPGPYYHHRHYHGHYYRPYYRPPVVYYYPGSVYYYPPPAVVYAPPPAAYPAPPPVVYAPTSGAAPAPAQNAYCREYRGDATIDGTNQPFYGTACLKTDGKWHIVN